MRKTPCLVILGFLLFFLIANAVGRTFVQHQRETLSFSYTPPGSMLSNEFLEIVCGEFKGLVSDYLLLEIGSFFGSNQTITTKDWEDICRTFEQVLALDPYFQQTYLYVQGNLTWDAQMPEKAVEYLDISRKHRPWDWRPGNYMGFDYYYFLDDYANASTVFLETARIEGAPVLLALLGARFAMKTEQTDTAIMLLTSMLDDTQLEDNARKEIEQRINDLMTGIIDDPQAPSQQDPELLFGPENDIL